MTDTLNADDRQDYLDQPVNDLQNPRALHRRSKRARHHRYLRHAGKVLLGSLAVTGAIAARLLLSRRR
ncbi:hypothetical protein ACVXG7_26065 [Enterobacter hormaechei]